MPKAYSKEFKKRAINLVLANGGRSIVVATQAGVTHSCLSGWDPIMSRVTGLVDSKVTTPYFSIGEREVSLTRNSRLG